MNTIKEFLQEKSMSQSDLARRLAVRPSYISMIISGERPITDAFRWRWLEAFGPMAMRYLNGDDHDVPH